MKGLIVLPLLFLANFCFAQKPVFKSKKFIFGYDYGTSIPGSDFAKSDVSKLPMSRFYKQDTNKLNGYAKKGFHYDIYFTYKILRHLGITVAVSGDQDNYNINTLYAQYIPFFPPNTVAVSTGDNYYIVQYLIGPYVNITPVHGLNIELKALCGPTSANYPGLEFFGGPETELYTTQKGSAFGYNAGLGITYMVEEVKEIGLGIHLNANYIGANISYPSYSETYYTPLNVYLNSSTYSIPKTMTMSIIQVTLGVSLEF